MQPDAANDANPSSEFTWLAAGALDGGIPGRYFRSHAEAKQLVIKAVADPVSVNGFMCASCKRLYQAYADRTGVVQVVRDLGGVQRFEPGREARR